MFFGMANAKAIVLLTIPLVMPRLDKNPVILSLPEQWGRRYIIIWEKSVVRKSIPIVSGSDISATTQYIPDALGFLEGRGRCPFSFYAPSLTGLPALNEDLSCLHV